ncbi:D-alanyl-D-alanine carboxypeptidase family protein [Hespellia stercorisuis]|uniref:D-alanyl-D-alanine carboxypeptidase n=1 Tax=Hespellia stercorisuis DSM 15480 TaxID=1121950 RepID=A0A1M6SL14_9FIRM|nr:D-alanyl-D-alanine carboxypeptidase family protein [Hespellia stercorisuis]SHK45340.1 D-alanyl-D-alanine carboxypeptidase [Hespellia stercorisuis DSM 15480]
MKVYKRVIAAAMTAMLLFTMGGTARAEDVAADPAADTAADAEEQLTEQQKQEAKIEAEVYAMPVESNGLPGWPQGPGTYGEGAIVMDIGSGAILYAKNIDAAFYPASITKVLTALVALENSQMTDEVKFTDDSVSFMEYGDASIGMRSGEVLSMKDALYGMLLASANEVAHAIAENATGSGYDDFIQKMNDDVAALGGVNSHFVNPNGLHDENHYTCARDMALIGAAAFRIEDFRTITKTLEYTIGPTNLEPESRVFQQNHKMLYPDNKEYYQYCVGGKTGYTDQALSTLLTYADDGEFQLVSVVLKTHGIHVYPDTTNLMNYAFGNFSKVSIADNEKSGEFELKDPSAYVVLPEGVTFADLKSTVKDGKVTYTYNDNIVGTAEVTEKTPIDSVAKSTKNTVKPNTDSEKNTKSQKKQDGGVLSGILTWLKNADPVVLGGIGAAVLVIVILLIVLAVRSHQKKKRRRARREELLRRRREAQRRNGRENKRKNI